MPPRRVSKRMNSAHQTSLFSLAWVCAACAALLLEFDGHSKLVVRTGMCRQRSHSRRAFDDAKAQRPSALLMMHHVNDPALRCTVRDDGESDADTDAGRQGMQSRRAFFVGLACSCVQCARGSPVAHAEAVIKTPPADLVATFDKPRNKGKDAAFANGMAFGMVDYEQAVADRKRALFRRLFASLPQKEGLTVIELGMGTFPNAPYFADPAAPPSLDIVGVDPNDSMKRYALGFAAKAGLDKYGHKLRFVHGVSEVLPFEDASVDAVVCTLTLCSVLDVARGLAEIKRVLRPGSGRFLFHEHVISETDPKFAEIQRQNTPMQVVRADGCHLDRHTLQDIRDAGFPGGVNGEYFELKEFSLLNPTVQGIASA